MDASKIVPLEGIVDCIEENPLLLDSPPLEFNKNFVPRQGSQRSALGESVDKIEKHHRKSKNNIENGENNNLNENPPSQLLHSLSVVPKSQLSLKERFNIIRSIGEECIQEDELEKLLANKSNIICYDGFEPSGRMHIAQGVMKAISVNKMTSAGVKVKIWIADLFAEMNKKMGGNLEKIQVIGHYMIEIWKALGIDEDLVEFVWASEEISSRPREYFSLVTDIASRNSLSRILRCCQIMGRSEKDELWASQIFYPCMQCADIFFLKADICQLGMDQRKVNMLAREYCDDIKRKNKPIILSHHMLPGLLEGQEKMSKSDPSSSIFMEDDEDQVNVKISNAFYPRKVVENNPCLEYIKHLIFPLLNEFTVEQKTFKSFGELIVDYESGEVHSGNLKLALAKALNRILQPVRDHFINDPKARELLKRVKVELNAKKIEELLQKSENNVENEEHNINENLPSQLLHSFSLVPKPQMSLKERFSIIRSIGEGCIYEDELEKLLANKSEIVCYDGFEPSGRMHIAEGVMKAINVKKMTSAGVKVKLWIADLFARMNKKLGGDEKKIKVVGQYMIEIWTAMGMNIEGQVEFLWASDEICSRSREYDAILKDISKRFKVSRILRCREIMGQSEKDELLASHVLYPCMQCADIFFLKADICQMGMDQHEVNMLARDYCDDIKRKDKPIIVSHHMLPGLHEGQKKMSKTDPSSCIFMEDEEVDVNVKIKKAFCPPKVVENNPCLELIKHLIFPSFNEFTVERKPNNGGDKTFKSFEELIVDYESGEVHPGDLKPAIAKSLNRILQPVRDHFINDPKAKELLKRVKSYRVTR